MRCSGKVRTIVCVLMISFVINLLSACGISGMDDEHSKIHVAVIAKSKTSA